MTTKATAIANRLRQIRDRSQPATKARSAGHVSSTIYANARLVYLDGDTFTAIFPDKSLLVVSPAGPVVPRGHAKADALVRARQIRPHSPVRFSDSTDYDAIAAICTRATSGHAQGLNQAAAVLPRSPLGVLSGDRNGP